MMRSLVEIYRITKVAEKEVEMLVRLAQLHYGAKAFGDVRTVSRAILRVSPEHEFAMQMMVQAEERKGRREGGAAG